jgi:hypothetical protein
MRKNYEFFEMTHVIHEMELASNALEKMKPCGSFQKQIKFTKRPLYSENGRQGESHYARYKKSGIPNGL